MPLPEAPPDPPAAVPLPAVVPHARDSLFVTVRRILHTSVLFVSLFVFIRTFALEPFGVPTGSMAPALFGNHREADCPRCGFHVAVGDVSQPGRLPLEVCCPNCGQRNLNPATARDVPGDRLMVDKNVFQLRSPRRWEVAVFRCPVDLTKPYVKRIIGLPGEAVQLRHGDVFADGVLVRKTLAEVKEARVLIFDQAFAPPGGWGSRWLVEPVADAARTPAKLPSPPAGPEILHDGAIHLLGGDGTAVGLTYRNWNLDALKEEPITDALAYNGPPRMREMAVHDFIVEFDLEVLAGGGSFACRLSDGLDSVFAEIAVGDVKDDRVKLGRDGDDAPQVVGQFLGRVGRSYRVVFALVDRRASLSIDGKAMGPCLDLAGEISVLEDRRGVSRPVQLGTSGVSVAVKQFKLYRDVHYRTQNADGSAVPNAGLTSLQLAGDEYFLAGDNSGNSHDSREWRIPGVPERDFIGKPFLIHQPLTVGRVTVNGRERVYNTVDWQRLRWVR